jgi:hypothetical protein
VCSPALGSPRFGAWSLAASAVTCAGSTEAYTWLATGPAAGIAGGAALAGVLAAAPRRPGGFIVAAAGAAGAAIFARVRRETIASA